MERPVESSRCFDRQGNAGASGRVWASVGPEVIGEAGTGWLGCSWRGYEPKGKARLSWTGISARASAALVKECVAGNDGLGLSRDRW